MKRWICIVLALAMLALSGCDRRNDAEEEVPADANFDPEATAIGGLTQALEAEEGAEEAPEGPAETPGAEAIDDQQAVAQDQPLDGGDARSEGDGGALTNVPEAQGNKSPFATATPQPNASVSQYAEVSAAGLGFRFSYPTGWTNIPGRNTVCYVQPLEKGTVYPARVAVTMKRMPHIVGKDEMRTEFANYVRTLATQYDSATFKVNTTLDEETKFMGNAALSTTYLAYDGAQEIKGYAIITRFERFLYVFHFLCAYNDYDSFEATIRYMRDSVRADASVAPET